MVQIRRIFFEDKADWIGPKVAEYFLKNPTLLLTSLYLLISSTGLVYEYILFSEFDINVLDYSEAADFFLAAFKRPEAFLTSIGIVATLVVYRRVAIFARKLQNTAVRIFLLFFFWLGLFRREILIPIGIAYFFSLYVLSAQTDSNRIVFRSENQAKISTRYGSPNEFHISIVGTTEKFLFGVIISDELSQKRKTTGEVNFEPLVIAIPYTNICRIEYQNSLFTKWRIPLTS